MGGIWGNYIIEKIAHRWAMGLRPLGSRQLLRLEPL